jgi:catecholate siderophore receptor
MTRPAGNDQALRKNQVLRKKRRERRARVPPTSPSWAPSWTAMGAFVASAAFAAVQAAPASASDLSAVSSDGGRRGFGSSIGRVGALIDPRFVILEDALRPRLPMRLGPARRERAQRGDTTHEPLQPFDLMPGPIGAVAAAFERLTGVKVTVSLEAIRTIHSPGVTGTFTIEQALQQLLAGTGVAFHRTGPTAVTLDLRAVSESVEVTGRASTAIVSSPKFTTPVRDIPQTINILSSTLLEQQGATTLRDALRNVTGITFQAGEGGTPAGDQMTIRGFSARTDMFVDGVRDTGGYSRDTFNLEQVEVAKGPSSAIAGRGSTGASINMVSKAPRLTPAYSVTAEGGNADFRRGTVDVNQPLSRDLGDAIRLNAMWTDAGVPGRDAVENKSWAVAPSVAIGLMGPTRLTLSYQHMSQNNLPDYGLPWVPATNLPLAAYANGTPPVDQSNFYGLTHRDYEKIQNNLGTVQVEQRLGGEFSFRNLTRYGTTRRDSVITSPRFVSNTSTDVRRTDVKSRDQTDNILANQTNVTGRFTTARLVHAVVTGLEFSREGSKNYLRAETGPDNPISPDTDLFNPNPDAAYTGVLWRTGAFTDGTAASVGAYAFETLSLADHWQLTGGLRWDRFDVDYTSVAMGGVATPLSRTDKMISGRAGVVYKPRTNGSIYLGYASAFNPSAEGLALTTTTVNLEPEKTRNYEVGTKWDLSDERLAVNAAVFRTEKTNARTPGLNPGDPPTVLAGKQVVQGVEMGVSGTLRRGWSGFASYSYMHSDITASNTAAEVDANLALTPDSTFSLWSTYEVSRNFSIGGGSQYMDAVFRNAVNTTDVPSYWLFNAVGSYAVNSHLTLRLNANNLADRRYVDRVGGGHYIPGPGRSVLVSTSVKF